MKQLIFALAVAATISPVPGMAADPASNVLSSPNGTFVMGSIETGASSVFSKDLFLLDTATGQVWQRGCITWDKDDKCIRVGLRPMGFSDGAGGKVFDNAEAWSYANDFGRSLRDAERNSQKSTPPKK